MVDNVDTDAGAIPRATRRKLPQKVVETDGNDSAFLQPLDPPGKIHPNEVRPFILGNGEMIEFRLDDLSVVATGQHPCFVPLRHAQRPSPADAGLRPAIWFAGVEGKAETEGILHGLSKNLNE